MAEKPNRNHKDSVFTDLFQNHPENFLSLYNAIHDTNLKMDEVTMEPKRLEQSIYHTMHNDVSMLINGRWIVLIEHQSTINENMPVRLLNYVSRIYEKLIPNDDKYRKNIFYLPEPEFYVFYNGTDPYPDEKVLRLSDSYVSHSHEKMLELEVTVYNIHNPKADRCLNILNKCATLKGYCDCIDTIRRVYKKGNRETYDAAINECLEKGYLGEYLIQAAKEKRNMLFGEYDYETDIRVQRQESFEAGERAGVVIGEKKKADEDAVALLKEGDSIEKVARCIGISLEHVKELAEQIKT